MARHAATRTLLAPRADVWAFVADPHRLPDWWPGIQGVVPDRRGFSPGARWRVQGADRPGLLSRAHRSGTLLVREVREPGYASWHLTAERLDVAISLDEEGPERTLAALEVSAPWSVRVPRRLPQQALGRLYNLCQTGWPAAGT